MPTLAQVRTAADNWLAARWPLLVARQDAYAAAHGGKSWQGLWTHVGAPEHNATTDGSAVPDNLASHPTDQAASWLDALSELQGVSVAARFRIDVYDGPKGRGWNGRLQVRYDGTTYERGKGVGPEAVDFAWREWREAVAPSPGP